MTRAQALKSGMTESSTYHGVFHPAVVFNGKPYAYPDWCQHRDACLGLGGLSERPDYKGKAWHFMRMCDTFFSDPDGHFHMEWNPNAVRIINEYFSGKFVSIMGCASSGKSYALACIAVGLFLMDPLNTKVLVTSTTIESAKGKVWGDISFAWDQVEAVYKLWGVPPPGKKMASHPIIRYELDGIISHKAGIELVPTQQSSEKQSVEKVQGYHNSNVIFLGDEWDTLPQGLVKTVRSNMTSNPNSRCLAAFNPTGRFTPGGIISKPKAGWDSITIDTERWETDFQGICIRFDGEKSPNVIAGYAKWKGLTTVEKLAEYKTLYGSSEAPEYFTMARGWFPSTGELECIYSDAEITQYLADHKVNTWMSPPVKIAGLDPAFTHGGDNAMLVIGQAGMASVNGAQKKVFERLDTINLDHFITDKTVAKDEQVVRLVKEKLSENNIEVKNLAVDVTGAPSFASLLNREIGTGWMQVHSSSSPTSLPISRSDSRKGTEVFDGLMSELWYVGKPLIREGQVKGLDPDTIEEMCSRTYKGTGKKNDRVVVESKKIMKRRTGKSPDRSDALFLCLHVTRTRHGLSSAEKSKPSDKVHASEDPFAFLKPSWGQKQVQPVQEQDYIASGGGWGD